MLLIKFLKNIKTLTEILISKKYKDSNGNSPVYSLDNLGKGPIEGATAEDKKMYEDFIKEVESTNTYKVQQDYAERLDEVENATIKNQEEFDTITSKKYQKEFIKKEEAKARQKEILSNIEATDSIARLEDMLSEYPDNEEIKNSINKKIDSIKTAEKEAAQLKKKETLKQNFKNQITSATDPDALLALRNEFEKSDILSGEDKEELSNLATSKATALAGGTPVNPIPGAGNVATGNVNNTDEQNDIERGKVAPEYESNSEEIERVQAEKSQTISEVAIAGKGWTLDSDGKVVAYERTQAEDGPNSVASLSRNYNQIDENDTLSREEVSNEIISSTPLKILLNPNNLLPSTKVTFSADENYSGPVYKSDSTTKETIEWQARLQEIKEKYGDAYKTSPEYLNEVPVKAVDGNGDLVFYMHDTAWINDQNLEGSETELDIARESLVLLRTHVITKGEWTTEIESRSPGVLLRTKNNENFPVSEVMPDENLVLGIGTSDGDNTFVTNGKPIEGTITGKNPRNGGAYAIVRLAKGQSVAIPLSRMSLSEQVANTMYKAIEAHLAAGNEDNTDNPIVNAIFEATESTPGAGDGINIASINGLREYLKQFTYLFPVEKGVTLENILTSSTKKFTSDNGIIAVTGNNIQFGKPGVNIGGATKAITLSQNFKSNANGLLQLKDFLSSLKTNASKQHLKADKPVVLLNDDNTTNTISSYSEFVKTQFQTNIFSANIGTDENPDWIYTIQPKIQFSTEGVELPTLPAKPEPVATPPQTSTAEEGIVVPLGKYNFTVMPNGEVISNATGKPIKQDGKNAEKARKLAAEQKPVAPIADTTQDGPGNLSEDAQFEAAVVEVMKMGKKSLEESINEIDLEASPDMAEMLKVAEEALKRLNAQEDVSPPTKRKIGDLTVEDQDDPDGDEYDGFTPEIEDLEGDLKKEAEVNIIEGISTEEQNSLVGFLSQKIIEEAENQRVEGKEGPISVKPIFNKLRKDLEGVKSYYKEKGLKRKLEKVNKVLDQFEKLQEITAEYLSVLKTGRVSEASADENEGILERTSFSDDFNFTLDSKTTASAQLRQFFGFTHYDVENTNSVGLPAVVDFDTVYNTLHEILANQPSDYGTMIQVMEDYSDAFPWMKDIIKKLEEADESIQNEFVSDMAKHAITMRFVLWQKNSDGTYRLLDQNANSSSIQKRIMAIWNSNLKGVGTQSNLISIDAESGEYIYNEDKAEELIEQAKEWSKLSNEDIKQIPFEDLSAWLGNFGIVLSDKTYRDLKIGRLYNNGKLYYSEVIKSNRGPIQALASELNKAITGKVTLTGTEADLLRDSAVRALAKLEAKNSYNTYSNSFNAGGKTVYTYTNNKYLTNRVRDLLSDDQKLLKELKEISFSKDSLWLNELLSDDGTSLDPTIKTTLGIDYLSLEALKQLFSPSKDNRKLNNLTAAEQELIKVALFQHNSTVKDGRRKASFFYPTMSDKSTMMIVNALAYNLGFENILDISINKEATDLLFNALVLPEINRINAAKKDSNIDGYEPSYFYFLPALNTLEISVAGVVKTVRDHAIDNLENVTSEEARTQIGTELKNIFKTLVEEKLEDWENLGIGQFNDQNKFDFLNKDYMQKVVKARGKDAKIIYAAADYVFNNLIANSETFKLFIGDPAQYAKKITTNEDGTINLDETFVNIGKRLAGDIAPGMELANSEDNTYFQLFLNDPEFSSKNIEFIESLNKKGLISKEDLKAYKEIEATDAQEYTTWQEHLYVMKQLGRLTRKEYDRVYKLLNTGKKLSDADLGLVFQPMKPVYVGNKVSKENNIDRRFYIKSSSFPLLPQLTAGLEIDKVREALEQFQRESGEKNSDGVPTTVRASFSSANKVGGAKNGIEVFDADGNVNINIDNINPTQYVRLSRKNFRIQQDVPYKETKNKVNIGTQERKLLFLNILDVDGFSYKGKNYKGKDLKAIYDNLYKEIFKNSYDKFLEEYGIDVESGQVPVSKIKDILVKEIRSREGYPLNMLSSLELNEAGDNFVIPLWASPYAKKFESLLTAAVSNNIVKQKFPGHSYVLGAEEGFKLKQGEEATEDLKNSSIVFTKNYDKEQGLLPMRKDPKTGKMLPAQIMIPFKFRDEEGNLMSASRFIGEDGLLDTTRIPEKVLQLWGFRIPTQGPNSMAAIEVVGFLPKSSGDLILAPRDFIAQMGSDFDVDKLYTYMYNTYFEDGKVKYDFLSNQDTISKELKKVETEIEAIKEELNLSEENLELLNKEIDRKIEYLNNNKLTREEDKKKASDIIGKDFRIQADLELKESVINSRLNNAIRKKARLKKSYVASRQNDIIEIHASIMANSTDQVLRGMYKPDSFGDLGTIADRVNKLKQKPVTTILSDTYQRTKFINGTAGKAGTGVFSLDSTFNAMAQDQNLVYFIPSEPMATDGLNNTFSIKFGKALSKGDLSSKNTLVGNKLKSDIITALQSASVDNEKAQILDKLNINGETFEVVKALALLGFDSKDIAGLLTQPIIIEYVEMLRTAKSSLSEYNANAEALVENALKDKYNSVENIDNLSDDQLSVAFDKVDSLSGEDLLKLNEDPNNILEEGKISDYNVNQLILLKKFLTLNEVGKDIRTVQSAINTESKGIESSLLGVQNKVSQINNLPVSNNIVNATNLLGDFKEGVLETPTTVSGFASYYGTMLANTIYNKYFPYNRPGYKKQIADIINHYKIDNGELSPSQQLELEKEVFENMKSFFYSNIDLGLFTENVQKERKRLFIDTEDNQSLATIINNFSNKKWFASNAFLNKLTTDVNTNGNISRVFYEAASGENLDERPVYTGFQKLFNDNKSLGEINGRNYTTRNLAQDLVLYAFLEGGAQKARQFIKYIPTTYLKATNFGPVLSNTTFNYETNFGGLAEEIFAQEWAKQYKNPSKFTRQYFQNYPQNAHQFTLAQVTQEVKNVNNLKQFSPNNLAFRLRSEGGLVVKVNKDDGQKLFTKYVSIKDPSVPAGFALFEFDYSGPPMYKRIVTTADQYNFKQYDYSKDINIPLQRRNDFSGKQIIYASNTKTITAQNSSKDRVGNEEFNPNIADNTAQIQTIGPIKTDKKKAALEKFNDIIFQLETSEDVSDYNKKLIEEFKKVGFPKDLKLNIISDPNKGIGSWNSIKNVLTLNTSKLKDVSMDRMATIILHEMTHSLTSPLINSWVNKDFKSLTNEQKGTIAKLDGLRIKYIKNLENNGKLEELNSFYKAYLDSRLKNGTLSQKAYDKRLANWSNTISDQFTGTGTFTKEVIAEFYGAINTKEFVAMALTDAAFQKKLNDINDSDGAPFWNKITKLLTQLLKSLGIDVQPNSLLATALEETMSLINSNNNTVKTEFTDGKPEFAVDPNVAFKIGDIVEYKGEQGTVERVRTDIVNGIGVRLPDGNLRDIKPSNLAFISSAPTVTPATTQPTVKIISGGQTGVDQLGLEVGKELGIETGGTAPVGFLTEAGKKDPSLAEKYGVKEITAEEQDKYAEGKTDDYTARTEMNIIDSDGTVYFATDEDSRGKKATENFAKKHNKPFLLNPTAEELKQFLIDNNIKTLNIAGNRGSKLSAKFKNEISQTLKTALGTAATTQPVKNYEIEVFFNDTGETETVSYYEKGGKYFARYPYNSAQMADPGNVYDGKIVEITKEDFIKKPNNLRGNEKIIETTTTQPASTVDLGTETAPAAEETSTTEVKKESSFTYNGITLKTEFPLGEQQEVALKELINFALDPNPSLLAWTLEGYAGTGKTSIIALVEQYLKKAQPGSKFAYIAPTHAATVALGLNTIKYGNKDLPATLASSMYLKKVKGVPTPTLTRKIMDRLQGFNRYIVIDEASMLKKGEVEQILAAAAQQNIKVIFTGDPKQIPAVVTGNIKQKPVSPVFNFEGKSVLDKVYRTGDQALLDILTKIRNNTDFVEYKSDENTEELQFVTSGIYARELRKDLEENPEDVSILSYTNQSVQQNNKSAREMLGIEGELQKGEKIIGYLGSGVKTVDKQHLANSIAYTVTKVKKEEEGKVWITADSNTLKQVIDKGMKIPSSKTTFAYLQLSKTDSLDFNLTEEQLENNNKELSSIYREIHRLKQSYDAKKISYTRFLESVYQQQLLASDYNTGNAYIYNPASDKMELYNRVTHKYLDSKLKTDKGIDFGYAITIHKSQGMTIPKVYFDPSSLRPAGNVKVMSGGKQINTEKNSLYYVAMSRASKKLVVLDTGGAKKGTSSNKNIGKAVSLAEGLKSLQGLNVDTSKLGAQQEGAREAGDPGFDPRYEPDFFLPSAEELETFKRNCG
jgi:hypothetical protein